MLDTLAGILIVLTLMGVFLYGVMFNDVKSGGFGGHLHVLLVYDIPDGISGCIRRTCGAPAEKAVSDFVSYILYARNPLMQVFYLFLVCGGYGLFMYYSYPMIPNPLVSSIHGYIAPAIVALALWSFVIACTVPPGRIIEQSILKYDRYKYDEVLYMDGHSCRTCKTRKLSRSKHCSVCDICVPRFDHHCGWLNQCVGQNNYVEFLFFLLVNCVLLLYGGWLTYSILRGEVARQRLFDLTFVDQKTGKLAKATLSIVVQYIVYLEPATFLLCSLCIVIGLVLIAFLLFHLWLISNNKTTNEFFKWRVVDQIVNERKTLQNANEGNEYLSVARPTNIYCRTRWENFREVFNRFPGSEPAYPDVSRGRSGKAASRRSNGSTKSQSKKK